MGFPPPGDLPDPGTTLTSPALVGGFFTTEPPGKPKSSVRKVIIQGKINKGFSFYEAEGTCPRSHIPEDRDQGFNLLQIFL